MHCSPTSKPFQACRIPITTSQKTKQNKKYSLCETSKKGTAQKKVCGFKMLFAKLGNESLSLN